MAPRPFLAPLVAAHALAAGAAWPGAWPRDPGAAFVSLRTDLETDGGASGSLYAEYGLTSRITLVAQLSNANEPWTASRAGAALRFALSGPDAAHRFALSLGASTPPTMLGVMTEHRIETALHWGRGFESRWGGGWATATARVLFARDEAKPITDVSALVGLRPRDGWMAMLSASRYEDADGVFWKVSPSVGYELRDRLWLVPSLTQELTDDRSAGVGLALWFSF